TWYRWAIVTAALARGRGGAFLGAVAPSLLFCALLCGMENGHIRPATRSLAHPPLPATRIALTVVLNLSAFFLAGALASFLAEQVQGARAQLAERQARPDKPRAPLPAVG